MNNSKDKNINPLKKSLHNLRQEIKGPERRLEEAIQKFKKRFS